MGSDATVGGSKALIGILDERVGTGDCNLTGNHATNNMIGGRTTKLRRLVRRMTTL
jgi:hypothetical protein